MLLAWTNFWSAFANFCQIGANITNGGVIITRALEGKASVVAIDIDMEVDQAMHARKQQRASLGLAD
jgi:hypothetical protein